MNTPDPDPGYRPPNAPTREPPSDDRGSLLQGFLLGWAVLIGSYVLMGILMAVLASLFSQNAQIFGPLITLVCLLPIGGIIALIVRFISKGQTRTAAGVGLTIASVFGLILLLVAACFGLLATSNFH